MRGTASPDALCAAASRLGMDTLALTDTNGLYGLIFFLQAAADAGVRPIVGAEVVTLSERAVLLVRDREGYSNLCRILTRRHTSASFSLPQELAAHGEGLVVLSGSLPLLAALKGKSDLYAELGPGYDRRLPGFARGEEIPLAATGGVYFEGKEDHRFHVILRAIDLNTKLSRLPAGETAPLSAWLAPGGEMASRFPHMREALENTEEIAEKCRFTGDFGALVSPTFEGLGAAGVMEELRKKAYEGAERRYGTVTVEVRQRLEYELGIIGVKGFGAVFLMVEDMVKRAPRTCGRGSAAASIVSYALGITHVDPIRHHLYFERFLNPGRKDPPDIDVDFPWDERDAILDYVFGKYGPERSAMVANHVGFRPRAAVREVAKVFGLPDGEIKQVTDRLSYLWHWQGERIEEVTGGHPLFRGLSLGPPWPEILAWANRLLGTPRHLSVHCGGVVIVPDRLARYVPVEEAPKGVRIIQWEKDQAEDAGLMKIDVLGNRSLAVIRDALEAVRAHTGRVIPYDTLNPLDDPEVRRIIAAGDTLGVFYIESPAMRQLQKKTGKGDYEHLVIHSSIIRPAANRYINEYVRRLKGGPYTPIHPVMDRVLHETYGIMVYQEDVSKISVEMAGFPPEDGDGLRKTLSKKRNAKKLCEYRDRFFEGAGKRGIGQEVAGKVWEMIMSFSGYSFCKPHSASYALVSFKSAYLRVYYPAEFMAAVISNQGGYYSTFAYISEARRMGLDVLPPDINESELPYTGRGRKIRVGLMQIKGLASTAADAVLGERRREGPYRSLDHFLRRVSLNPSDVRLLIKAGCFDRISEGRSRPEMLWLLESGRGRRAEPAQTSLDLYGGEVVKVPRLAPYDLRTVLLQEVEVLGFLLSVHPLALYEPVLGGLDIVPANQMERHVGREVSMIGWWVTNKLVYTRNEEPMAFISFEDTTALYETVFFPEAFRRHSAFWSPVRPYLLKGSVESDMGAVSLHVREMSFLSVRMGANASQPMAFHAVGRPMELKSGKRRSMVAGTRISSSPSAARS